MCRISEESPVLCMCLWKKESLPSAKESGSLLLKRYSKISKGLATLVSLLKRSLFKATQSRELPTPSKPAHPYKSLHFFLLKRK